MTRTVRNRKMLCALIFLSFLAISSCAQQTLSQDQARLIGRCEGCEAIFEYGQKRLSSVDTLPDFHHEGMKIKVSGTVYQNDGQTPAPDVILYVYHTNQEGVYENKNKAKNWERHHGYIRGWVKTDNQGQYTFYTLRPAAYPSRSEPEHIHLIILEPGGRYYWLDSYNFSNDPLLTEKERSPSSPRGGTTGLLTLKKEEGLWTGERDIILGRNVPGY